jgi:hypothetical protein
MVTSYRILTIPNHIIMATGSSPPPRVEGPRSRRAGALAALALLLIGCPGEAPDQGALPPLPPPVEEPLRPAGEPRPPTELGITLVGEVRGEILPCGCPSLPMGGFERRAGLRDELESTWPPLFHLDAGNLLVEGYATGGRGDIRDRAELLMDLSAEVGVDALCPGPADLLVLGPGALRRELEQRGIVAVAATWLTPEGDPLLPPATVLERGGVRLGVVGLSAAPRDAAQREHIRFLDPVLAARKAVAALPDDITLVVALSNLDDDANNRVASEVEELAAILSVRNDAYDEPRERALASVIEVPNRGRYVTAVRIRSAAEPGRALELRAARELDLETYDHIVDKLARLDARGETLAETERSKLEEHAARLERDGAGRNLAYVLSYPLGTRYEGDPSTSTRIRGFEDRVMEREVLAREEERSLPDGPARYVSASRCFVCHTEQYSRWALTEHTNAYSVLLDRGAQERPECLSCHTTGFAVEGGWAELEPENILAFKAVQCEACHGPAGNHPDDPDALPTIPTEATCVRCHDADNSPGFEYQSYLNRARCTAPPFEPPAESPDAGLAPSPPSPSEAGPHDR